MWRSLVVFSVSLLSVSGCTRAKQLLGDDNGARGTTNRGSETAASAPDPSRCAQEYFVGTERICARLKDGSFRCRGENEFKQGTHGNWPGLPPPTPSVQAFPGPWHDLKFSSRNTCGLRAGRLWCWGDNRHEDIRRYDEGTVEPAVIAEPTLVEGVPPGLMDYDLLDIVLCTLHKNGQATCRMGSPEVVAFPQVPKGVEEIVAGLLSFCVRSRQEVWCHGAEPWMLDASDPHSPETRGFPRPPKLFKIEGIPGPLKAMIESCVLNDAGEVWCWGLNDAGQFGDGTEPRYCSRGCPDLNPKRGHRARLPSARQIASDGVQVCAVTDANEVWCWGESTSQSIGVKGPQALPVKVERLGNDNLRVYGARQWCVEKLDHRLLCWGNNNYQQISDQPCVPERSDCPVTEVKFSCEK